MPTVTFEDAWGAIPKQTLSFEEAATLGAGVLGTATAKIPRRRLPVDLDEAADGFYNPLKSGVTDGVTVVPKGGEPRAATQADLAAMPEVDDEWETGFVLPLRRNKRTGEVSVAMPGVVTENIKSAVTLPGDVYAGRADPATPEGVGRSLGLAALATPLSAARAGGIGWAGAPKTPAGDKRIAAPKIAAPSTEALKDMAQIAYKRADDAGLMITKSSFRRLAIGMIGDAKRAGLDKTLHPKAVAALWRVAKAGDAGRVRRLRDIDTLRQVVKDAASSADRGERRIAQLMVRRIDKYMDDLTVKDVVAGKEVAAKGVRAGDATVAVNSVKEARSLWGRMRKAEIIDGVFEKAKNAVGANYTQAGMETALRQKFRQLLDNEKAMRGFTKDEKMAIVRVVRGGPVENLIRGIGKMAIRGPLTGGIGLGVAAMTNPFLAGGLALTGEAARRGASALTMRSAKKASELVRRGEP